MQKAGASLATLPTPSSHAAIYQAICLRVSAIIAMDALLDACAIGHGQHRSLTLCPNALPCCSGQWPHVMAAAFLQLLLHSGHLCLHHGQAGQRPCTGNEASDTERRCQLKPSPEMHRFTGQHTAAWKAWHKACIPAPCKHDQTKRVQGRQASMCRSARRDVSKPARCNVVLRCSLETAAHCHTALIPAHACTLPNAGDSRQRFQYQWRGQTPSVSALCPRMQPHLLLCRPSAPRLQQLRCSAAAWHALAKFHATSVLAGLCMPAAAASAVTVRGRTPGLRVEEGEEAVPGGGAGQLREREVRHALAQRGRRLSHPRRRALHGNVAERCCTSTHGHGSQDKQQRGGSSTIAGREWRYALFLPEQLLCLAVLTPVPLACNVRAGSASLQRLAQKQVHCHDNVQSM